jgi:hypothetical protein
MIMMMPLQLLAEDDDATSTSAKDVDDDTLASC